MNQAQTMEEAKTLLKGIDMDKLKLLLNLYYRYASGSRDVDSNHISDFLGWVIYINHLN